MLYFAYKSTKSWIKKYGMMYKLSSCCIVCTLLTHQTQQACPLLAAALSADIDTLQVADGMFFGW